MAKAVYAMKSIVAPSAKGTRCPGYVHTHILARPFHRPAMFSCKKDVESHDA